MLGAFNIIAFAATVDSVNARIFYERVLGLRFLCEDEFAVVYDAHGIEFRIQKVQALTPQPHTQLGWSVSSIHDAVRELSDRGAVFEKYVHLVEQDSHGVWTAPSGAKIAWLKDPDGNLLSLTEPSHR
jgi:catechol 2,3-dioxygenase-like lactoylglutathione lyase family enzyme